MMFSVCYNTYTKEPAGRINLGQAFRLITGQATIRQIIPAADRDMVCWRDNLQRFQNTGDIQSKLRLPAIIFFATTDEQDRKKFDAPSGYICIDIDHKDNLGFFNFYDAQSAKLYLANKIPGIALMFTSPSRKGIKVIHRIATTGYNLKDFRFVCRNVVKHFQRLYVGIGVTIDDQCSDWNRLCYLSYDQEAFLNTSVEAESIKIPRRPKKNKISYAPDPDTVVKTFQLSHYPKDKDQICPRCGGGDRRDKSFTYYIDGTASRIDGCGYCTRSKCKANIKPRELYPNITWKYTGPSRN